MLNHLDHGSTIWAASKIHCVLKYLFVHLKTFIGCKAKAQFTSHKNLRKKFVKITCASCRTSVPNMSEERRLPQPRMVQRRLEGSGWRGRGRHATPGGSVGHLAGSRSSATSLSTVSTSYWGCVTAYSTWANNIDVILRTSHNLRYGRRLSFRSCY